MTKITGKYWSKWYFVQGMESYELLHRAQNLLKSSQSIDVFQSKCSLFF